MSKFLNRNQIDLLLDEQRQILNCDISKKHECSSNIEFLKIEYNKRLRIEIKIKRRNQIEKLVEKLKLPPTNNYKRKSRIIESNYITIDKNVTQDRECAICLEIHPYNELIKTDCNHYFGNLCYSKWVIKSFKNNKNNIFCPLCKKKNPTTSIFIYDNKNN